VDASMPATASQLWLATSFAIQSAFDSVFTIAWVRCYNLMPIVAKKHPEPGSLKQNSVPEL
jgi:hypothetical protein